MAIYAIYSGGVYGSTQIHNYVCDAASDMVSLPTAQNQTDLPRPCPGSFAWTADMKVLKQYIPDQWKTIQEDA